MTITVAQMLDSSSARLVSRARSHPLYQLVTAEGADEKVVLAAVRNVLLRVHFYGPSLTRSIFHAIGRIATFDLDTARQLIALELEEAPHPGLAFRDYVAMGGDPTLEGQTLRSPAAFAVSAIAQALARHENPYAFLGFLHLLESTTPLFIEYIAASPKLRPLVESVDFLSIHRTQDVDHAATLRRLIDDLVAKEEGMGPAIVFGSEAFIGVYPFPIWDEALSQAEQQTVQPVLDPQ
jgi:hypothetical protein